MSLPRTPCFHVSLHDVAPVWAPEVRVILAQLAPRLGGSFSLAVVPAWRGCPLDAGHDRAFLDRIRGSGAEVLLHGYTHEAPRRGGLLGWLTGAQNELGALPAAEAQGRLSRGRALLAELLGVAPVGAVPPAWDPGRLSFEELVAAGLPLQVGLFAARAPGRRVALATCSWDTDRAGLLAPLGEALGRVIGAAWPSAIHHVVLHPLDVRRGWLQRGLARVDALLAQGQRPAHFSEILGAKTGSEAPRTDAEQSPSATSITAPEARLPARTPR